MVSGSTENFGMNKISTPENFVSLHLGYGRREEPKENDRNVRNDRVCDSSPGARSGRSATADRVCVMAIETEIIFVWDAETLRSSVAGNTIPAT